MPVLDLNVLRLGAFELAERPDVPVAVVIDEAVELAKRFSTDNSGRFVNGVLAALAAELRSGGSGIGGRAAVSGDPEGERRRSAAQDVELTAHTTRTVTSESSASELVTVDDVAGRRSRRRRRAACSTGVATFTDEAVAFVRDNSAAICLALTLSGIATFSILFGVARRWATTATSARGRTTGRSTTRRSGWCRGASRRS